MGDVGLYFISTIKSIKEYTQQTLLGFCFIFGIQNLYMSKFSGKWFTKEILKWSYQCKLVKYPFTFIFSWT